MPVLELLANRTNEPDVSLALKREDRKKIGPIESDMQLTVGRNSGRVDIGNIKQVRICAPGKPNIQSLADRRMRAVGPAPTIRTSQLPVNLSIHSAPISRSRAPVFGCAILSEVRSNSPKRI
jgi:hypothetical protein